MLDLKRRIMRWSSSFQTCLNGIGDSLKILRLKTFASSFDYLETEFEEKLQLFQDDPAIVIDSSSYLWLFSSFQNVIGYTLKILHGVKRYWRRLLQFLADSSNIYPLYIHPLNTVWLLATSWNQHVCPVKQMQYYKAGRQAERYLRGKRW